MPEAQPVTTTRLPSYRQMSPMVRHYNGRLNLASRIRDARNSPYWAVQPGGDHESLAVLGTPRSEAVDRRQGTAGLPGCAGARGAGRQGRRPLCVAHRAPLPRGVLALL